ncbi:CbtA family protein [Roseomonas elaeocarpi]|uniref:CbtA family protein n=1 Tax=Roseomonas elaeocarpi TaxID=907779 RepID=A0ABV6JY77_9PROT
MFAHLRHILLVAVLAGLMAGLVATAGHQLSTVPTILAAEVYEQAAEPAAAAPPHDHAAAGTEAGHDHAAAWEPRDGLERTLYTLLADVLTGVAYALMLGAAISLRGQPVDGRQGLLWGLAGFAVFTLAPSIGLPPEPPGMPVADLTARQLWWVATAALTTLGLGLVLLGRRPLPALLGVVLLVLPHLYGAPLAPEETSAVPEALIHRFVTEVMVVSLLFWATLGLALGALHARFRPRAALA